MDKWKIVVIVALLGALCGYGFFQQNAEKNSSSAADLNPAGQPKELPINDKLKSLGGKTPPAWNIAKPLWENTTAPISLESMKGSVSIIEFWRIGCSHCEAAAPFLSKLYTQFKPRGLKMVAFHAAGNTADPLNPENDWKKVQAKIQEWGITYPVAYDVEGKLFKNAFGGDTYPTMLVLDRTGKVVFMQIGDTPEKQQKLVAELDKLLKKN